MERMFFQFNHLMWKILSDRKIPPYKQILPDKQTLIGVFFVNRRRFPEGKRVFDHTSNFQSFWDQFVDTYWIWSLVKNLEFALQYHWKKWPWKSFWSFVKGGKSWHINFLFLQNESTSGCFFFFFFFNMSKFATTIKEILFCEVYVNEDFLIHSWLFFIRTALSLRFFKRKIIFWILTKKRGRSAPRLDNKIVCFFDVYLQNAKILVSCKFAGHLRIRSSWKKNRESHVDMTLFVGSSLHL